MYIYTFMNAMTRAFLPLLVLFPFLVGAGAKTPPSRAKTSFPADERTAWVGVVVNDDTWADEGVGLAAGAQWVVLTELGPGHLTVGPALTISTQSETIGDAPCDRQYRENIAVLGADGRFVLPVSAKVRPFARTGPGIYRFDTEYRDDDCRSHEDDEIDLGWMLGVGVEVDLGSSVRFHGGIDAHASEDDWIALGLGLSFAF